MQDQVLSCFKTLSDKEKFGMKAIWPQNLVRCIYDMLYQYGDYKLLLSSGVDRLDEDISEQWAQKVLENTCNILGTTTLNRDDVLVDIISSNTHSVVNILSPYLHSMKDVIFAWAREHMADFLAS